VVSMLFCWTSGVTLFVFMVWAVACVVKGPEAAGISRWVALTLVVAGGVVRYMFPRISYSARLGRFQLEKDRFDACFERLSRDQSVTSKLQIIKVENPPSIVKLVRARQSESGLQAEFIVSLGFPVKHSGFARFSKRDTHGRNDLLQRWRVVRDIGDGWYYFVD